MLVSFVWDQNTQESKFVEDKINTKLLLLLSLVNLKKSILNLSHLMYKARIFIIFDCSVKRLTLFIVNNIFHF